jgi:MFS family permease
MKKKFFYCLTFVASLGTFNFGKKDSGYSIAVLTNLEIPLNHESLGFVSIAVPLGAVFGCLLGCQISTRFGRRYCILIMNIVNVFGNFLVRVKKSMGFYWIFTGNDNYKAFVAAVFFGRFVCGLATGISSFIVPLYSKK